MNLAAPAVRALPPERLARMMTLTAEDVPPMTEDDERLPGFERELALLRKAAQEGMAPFRRRRWTVIWLNTGPPGILRPAIPPATGRRTGPPTG